MIASIVFKGMHNVGINGNQKIKVDGHLLSLADIPFVRYRFENYGETELEFIKNNKAKFNGPVHLAEVTLSANSCTVLDAMDDIDNLAKFLYVPIDDADIANGLKPETVELLGAVKDCFFDRVMIKDNSSMIYALAADRLKIEIEKALGDTFKASDIGVCGSPLSFRNSDVEGQACLTALWARKLMAEYAESADIVVPSASHECMTCCGCIQYLVVESDIPAPLSAKEKSAAKKASGENTVKEPKEPKAPKAPKPPKSVGVAVWDDDL